MFDSSGNMLALTSDERDRIRFGANTSQIFINDSNSKYQRVQLH